MVITINRNDGIFEPSVADELNKAFSEINKNILNYKTEPLEYKEEVQLLGGNSNSFRCGRMICLRDTFKIEHKLEEFEQIGKILYPIPYDIWCSGTTDNNENLLFHIKEDKVYAYGLLTFYPQDIHLCVDVIIPNA